MESGSYRLIDTDSLSWEKHVIGNGIRKVLHVDPQSGACVHLRYHPPGGSPFRDRRVYHRTVRETFFWLFGDLPNLEFSAPEDREGRPIVYRDGMFMDRPPLSLHGRRTNQESETGSVFLIWSSHGGEFEADQVETCPVPLDGDASSFREAWTAPHVVDSKTLAWEPHPSMAGLKRKRLAGPPGDALAGFYPASLVHVPPGWQPETLPWHGPGHRARTWLHVVEGDLPVAVFPGGSGSSGKTLRLRKGTYLDWTPPAVLGFQSGEVSEVGCVVLCVGHEFAA